MFEDPDPVVICAQRLCETLDRIGDALRLIYPKEGDAFAILDAARAGRVMRMLKSSNLEYRILYEGEPRTVSRGALDVRAREKLSRANLRHTVTGVLELLRAWYAPSRSLRGLADIHGLDRLRSALADGRTSQNSAAHSIVCAGMFSNSKVRTSMPRAKSRIASASS